MRHIGAFVVACMAAACGGGNPAAPFSPSPPVAGEFTGIRYNNIQIAHQFIVGSPVPSQNQSSAYCCWPLPVRNPGTYMFNLANFPLNVLPSGGSSNVISDSEMVLVGLNVSPAAGTMRFEWHKAVAGDNVVFTFTSSPSATWAYAYIGHFSWEINEPGPYYVLVDTPWGGARLDFLVTAQPVLKPYTRTTIAQDSGGGGGSGTVSVP